MRVMGRTLAAILDQARAGPASVRFADLCRLVEGVGYAHRRTVGSHRIYTAAGLPAINLQADGKAAKPYQVRQVLRIIDEHGLEVTHG